MKPRQLISWRKKNSYSQLRLADALGVAVMTVSRWERGVRKVPPFLQLALTNLEKTPSQKSRKPSENITSSKKEVFEKNEERFRNLVESTSDWVWEVDAKGRYTYVSPRVKDVLGYNPGEVIGKTPFDFMQPKELKKISKIFKEVVKSKEHFTDLENTCLHKNGQKIVLETNGEPFFDSKGKLLGYRGIDRDITGRKKTEEQITTLYDLSKKIASITSKDELLPWIAKEAAKLLGAEVCNCRIREGDDLARAGGYGGGMKLMIKEKIKIGESLSGLVVKEKKPLIIEDMGKDSRLIKEHKKVARKRGFVSFLGVPMMIGDRVAGVLNVHSKRKRKFTKSDIDILSSFADMSAIAIENAGLFENLKKEITERKQVEESLKLFADTFKYSTAGIYVYKLEDINDDRTLKMVLANPTSEKLVGIPVEDVIGRTLDENFPGLRRKGIPQKYAEVVRSGKPIELDDVYYGDRRVTESWFKVRAFPLPNRCVGVIFENITKKKKVEKEIKNESKKLQILYELSKKITSITSKEALIRWIAEEAVKLLRADGCVFRIREGNDLVYSGGTRAGTRIMSRKRIKIGESLGGLAAKEKRAIVSDNLTTDERFIDEHKKAAAKYGYYSYLGVPMIIDGRVVGAINVISKKKAGFTSMDVELLSAFADMVSVSLDNARLIENLEKEIVERRNSEAKLKSLHEMSKKISSIVSKDELLSWIAEKARDLLDADLCSYRLREGDYLVRGGGTKEGVDLMAKDKIRIGESISGLIVETKKIVSVSDNYHKDPRLIPEHRRVAAKHGFRAYLGVPMMKEEKAVGVMLVVNKNPRKFEKSDRELLSSFADMATVAIENARLIENLEKEIVERKFAEDQLKTLYELGKRIASITSKDELLPWIAEQAAQLLNADECVYRIREGDYLVRGSSTKEAVELMITERIKIGESLSGRVAGEKSPIIVSSLPDDPRHIKRHNIAAKRIGFVSFLGVPMMTGNQVVGVLNVLTKKPRKFTRSEVALLSSFADMAAIALENTRLFGDLENKIIEHKQAENRLRASLKEKEILLKEIHHRVKNNMQVISSMLTLQSALITNKKTVDILQQSQKRINSMALVHEKIYQTKELANISFKDYIETLMKSLYDSFIADKADILMKIDAEDLLLNIDTAVPLGLVINELATNVFKHAFKGQRGGELSVFLRSLKNKRLELIVKDNGKGLPKNLDIKNTDSLGLQIVTVLAEQQLKGRIKLNRDNGTEFQIVFKRVNPKNVA